MVMELDLQKWVLLRDSRKVDPFRYCPARMSELELSVSAESAPPDTMVGQYISSHPSCKCNKRSRWASCSGFCLRVSMAYVLSQANPDPTDETRMFRFRT